MPKQVGIIYGKIHVYSETNLDDCMEKLVKIMETYQYPEQDFKVRLDEEEDDEGEELDEPDEDESESDTVAQPWLRKNGSA